MHICQHAAISNTIRLKLMKTLGACACIFVSLGCTHMHTHTGSERVRSEREREKVPGNDSLL